METAPHMMVGLERMSDYRGFIYTIEYSVFGVPLVDVFTEPGFHKLPPSFPSLDETDDKVLDPLADKPLPQGWSRKIDSRSGRPYYEK